MPRAGALSGTVAQHIQVLSKYMDTFECTAQSPKSELCQF